MLALETCHIALFLITVSLLVQVPSFISLAIPREEHFDLTVATNLVGRDDAERHANANDIAFSERLSEVLPTEAVVHVPASVIAVYAEGCTMPAGQAPGRVRWGEEADCYTSVRFVAMTHRENIDLVVDRPRQSGAWDVEWYIREKDRVCAPGCYTNMSTTSTKLVYRNIRSIWRCSKPDATAVNPGKSLDCMSLWPPEWILAAPSVCTSSVVVVCIGCRTSLFTYGRWRG